MYFDIDSNKLHKVAYHCIVIVLLLFLGLSFAGAGEGHKFFDDYDYEEGYQEDPAAGRKETKEVTAKRLLVGGFGTVMMALFGFTGLILILRSGGGDSGSKSDSNTEQQLLFGSICLVVTFILFVYRLAIWWNRTIGRDRSF